MVSQGGYFRPSIRRAVALPPIWLGRVRQAAPVDQVIELTGMAIEVPELEPIDWPDAPLPIAAELPEDCELIEPGGCAPAIVAPAVAEVLPADPEPEPAEDPAPIPKPDWKRLAAALAKPKAAPAMKAGPTQVAMSAEPCGRCGIPGWRGCDHQLPYEAWTPADRRADHGSNQGQQKGYRKGGKGAIRL